MNDAATRVLLLTRNLPPVVGGMERLIGHVAEALAAKHELVVVGPRGAKMRADPLAFYPCPLSPPARFLAAAAFHSRRAARRHRPDLVFAGSGLLAPIARNAARRAKAPWAVYLHGLDIAAPDPVYRRLFVPAIRRADLVLANSRYTAGVARATGVPETRLRILPPGVEIPATADADAAAKFRALHRLPNGPILFGAGRLTPRKGFADFVARALPAILARIPGAQFVVAGEVPRHAAKRMHDEAAAIRRAADAAGIGEHVHLVGALDDAGLALAWAAAAVHVFPVRDDPADPEGFGMVALEAAAQGVPTVAFAAGGIPDAVADGESGRLVAPGEYEAFAAATIETFTGRATFAAGARSFAARFAWPRFDAALEEHLAGCLRGKTS